MIVLLDTSEDLAVCREQLGCKVEQLLTPLTRFKLQNPRAKFAIDNGAFAGFKAGEFKGLLLREKDSIERCRFVAVPDVVGSARRTLEVFDYWKYKLGTWPRALVAQDGLEDMTIPWDQIAAIFIGGSTKWKLGEHAANIVRAARAIGKWVHIGRVNTPGRFEYFDALDADSIDGTGLSQYTHMREDIWKAYNQPNLLTAHAPDAAESSARHDSESSIAETAPETTAASGSDDYGSIYLEAMEGRAAAQREIRSEGECI
jgi:hypothetical protein